MFILFRSRLNFSDEDLILGFISSKFRRLLILPLLAQ